MPRFALLLHRVPADYKRPTHYDLLLETGELCRSWALSAEPTEGSLVAAESLPDHRKFYLDYEGEVAGTRGSVTRLDAGEYEWITNREQLVRVALEGIRLNGTLELSRGEPNSPLWQCRYLPGAMTKK